MTLDKKIILGIDPGSIRCGFGVIKAFYDYDSLYKSRPVRTEHIAHGTIVLDPKKSAEHRLRDLAIDLEEIIKKFCPHEAVLEDVFFFKNARAALILGQARGVAIGVLGLKNIPSNKLSPTKVKSVIAGQGRAQKFQIAQYVAALLNIDVPSSKDASDALAIALAHAFCKDEN